MASNGPVVQTQAGAVRGENADGATRFLGIPYAEPPVGPLRFQAPQPRTPWTGVRECTEYGPTPQRKALAEITTIPEPSIPGEDTLTLNVFTPAPEDRTAHLPVLVWIHGGGYVAGSPASPWYDGHSFSRDGVVTVTVGYRLGFDGFGWLPDAPTNRGVRDWLLALEWVQANIEAFGGDPQRVTIAGQSAGGGAIMTLLTSPAAEGLFHRAVSVSGVPADVPLEDAKELAGNIAQKLGVELSATGFASVSEADLIGAQGFGMGENTATDPMEQLASLGAMDGKLHLGPVIDGELLVDTVEAGIQAGRSAEIPLIFGATRDEFGGAVRHLAGAIDDIPVLEALGALGLQEDTARDYSAALPNLSTQQVVAQYITDVMFRARMIDWQRLRGASPTWVYDFDWKSGASGLSEHCIDVPFIFDVLDAPGCTRVLGENPPAELASQVHSAWVQMIENGDPGWPQDRTVILGAKDSGSDSLASARVLAANARQAASTH